MRDRLGLPSIELRAGPPFGKSMHGLPHRAVAGHGDPPLFRAIGDIAIEAGESHLPQRRRKRTADHRPVGLRTLFAPHEAVP